ncbi:S-protein homolog 5-like [Cicer arietinum]|uniref:S-protein homolog n=1 Tax=Cicer arietinum TaxID=3827 RepID=A0A1S3EIS4_CICAR|nr:S-protein homolog 5-like [Cicer arietinum]
MTNTSGGAIPIHPEFEGSTSNVIEKPTVTVFINNNLTDGLQLGVKCKDKTHDIGYKVIKFGEDYIFSLRPNFFLDLTLYFCSFTWINGFHYFDIYDQQRDQNNCVHECHWKINANGPCKIKKDSIQCFPWKSLKYSEEKKSLNV